MRNDAMIVVMSILLLVSTQLVAAEQETWQPPAPLSPQASRDAIVVPEGFTVELVAAEPLVMDPISFAWGPDGRLWVVEMADYNWLPINDQSPGKPRGRVVFLTDTDGDGKYDKRTVFLDDLHYPTSVLPWRNGILVTAAPDILYAEDTTPNDDNPKADKREILYTGFGEGNPQLRVNGLQWGLDNWIYCANGWSHGVIKSTRTGKTLDIRGRDLRIRPDTGEIEPASGVSQYGRVRDDYGNWFGVDNSRLIIHYVFEDHHLRRNPHVAAPEPFVDLVMPRNPPCFPLGRKVDRLHAPYMANRFTSACGIAVYRDSLIKEFKDNVFICEPVHNLVTRRVLWPDGVTFKAERVRGEEQSEFLASTDEWFRPVYATTGPDGALWIADMYRAVIEHPQWLPKDFNKKVDWMQGSEKGRIYRVIRKVMKPRNIERLDRLDAEKLVATLESPNGSQRDLAHMALSWSDAGAVTDLLHLYREKAVGRSRPGVLHALSLLHLRGELHQADVDEHLQSDATAIAMAAVQLYPTTDEPPSKSLTQRMEFVEYEGNAAMALRIAAKLGDHRHPEAGKALARIAGEFRDPFVLAAVLSSARGHEGRLADTDAVSRFGTIPDEFFDGIVATAIGEGDPKQIALVIASIVKRHKNNEARLAFRMTASLLTALDRKQSSLAKLRETLPELDRHHIDSLAALFTAARVAVEKKEATRGEAIKLIGRGNTDAKAGASLLLSELKSNDSADWHLAIIAALAQLSHAWSPSDIPATVWSGASPKVRAALVDLLLRRDAWTLALMEDIAKVTLPITVLSPTQRQLLLQHKTPAIRELAGKIIQPITSNRAALLESHRDVLTTPGDIARGQAHFEKACAACHKIAGSGKGFGPDLGALSDRSPQALLTAILDPNQAVDPRYVNYLIETKEGETHTGILLAETGNAIILGGADGQRRSILRSDIDSMRSGGLSLMPEGLEQALGKQGLADVIAYVISASQPRRVIAAMKPAIIKADGNGAIHLPVTQAEAFGTKIDYETEDNNIGSWTQREDYLAWSIDVEYEGDHEIGFDYAADAKWLGNHVAVIVEDETGEQITRKITIPVTATKDDYHQKILGEIKLPRGNLRLFLKPEGPITGQLMHLRALRLTPKK